MPRAKHPTKAREAKRRGRAPRRRKRRAGNPRAAIEDALLTIADELDLVDQMLGCVPVLTMALQTMQDDPRAEGSIEHWISVFGKGHAAPKRSGQHVDPEILRMELQSAPEWLGDAARWRLQRVGRLLDAIRHSSKR